MRIAAVSYSDTDIYDGMCELVKQYPNSLVLFPITANLVFVNSVAKALKEHGTPYTVYVAEITDEVKEIVSKAADVHMTVSPIEDVLAEVTHGDILAIIDDGSEGIEKARDTIEENGLKTWTVDDGYPLDSFDDEFDDEDGDGDLIDALDVFTDALVRYITKKSLQSMKEAIMEAVIDQLDFPEDEDDDY